MTKTHMWVWLGVWVFSALACGRDVGPVSARAPRMAHAAILGGVPATDYPETTLISFQDAANGNFACTGVLVAPRLTLTAGHCVASQHGWHVRAPYAGNVDVPATRSSLFDYTDRGGDLVFGNEHDVAVLVLDSPINLASYPIIASQPAGDGAAVTDVGRDQGSTISETDVFREQGTVADAASLGYPYDYAGPDLIQPGDSGGPVFLNGTHTLIALNSAHGNGPQFLARTDLVRDWFQLFVRNPDRASCFVQGAILAAYNALGGVNGLLGDCVSNELPLPDGAGRASHFEQGSIYWSPSTGAHEVHGGIRAKYQSMGWETSPLGYPVGDEHDVPGGRQSDFQHGALVLQQGTGTVAVTVSP